MSGDPRLTWKVRAFSLAAGLGLAGIALRRDWLVAAGIAVLLIGFLLRWPARRTPEEE